ncbi:endonuclease V, partial [Bacillus sp. LR--39]
MHVKQIHSFNLNREEFVKTQQSLIHKINLSTSINLDS